MDAFAHPEKVGQRVVVIGGGLVGCEMALGLCAGRQRGNCGRGPAQDSPLPVFLSPIPNGQMIPDLFEYHHVNVLEGHKLSAVVDGKAILDCDGLEKKNWKLTPL